MGYLKVALAILEDFNASKATVQRGGANKANKADKPPLAPVDDFDAVLAGFERRATAIRERQGVPKAEAERLAYRELVATPWEELAALRWGPAVGDPEPGLVIDRPDRDRLLVAMEAAAAHPDAYALAEREAIRDEAGPDAPSPWVVTAVAERDAIRAETEPDPPAVLVATVEARDDSGEGEGTPGRALRYLTYTLRLDREASRSSILEWALKNGISESELLDAATQLGITRTLDGTTELWRLDGPPVKPLEDRHPRGDRREILPLQP